MKANNDKGAIMRITTIAGITGIAALSVAAIAGCAKSTTTAPVTHTADTTNHAPAVPNSPTPADSATGQTSSTLYLQWHCYDQDAGDTLWYTVQMGVGALSQTMAGISGETILVTGLSGNSNYVWQVKATDNHGASSTGPVWHFRTQ